jgi:hypothetical protein
MANDELWKLVMQKTQVSWEYLAQLDTRLRGYDGRAATFCLTREGGYPGSINQLGLSA